MSNFNWPPVFAVASFMNHSNGSVTVRGGPQSEAFHVVCAIAGAAMAAATAAAAVRLSRFVLMRLPLFPGEFADLGLRELEDFLALEPLLFALVDPRLPHLDRLGEQARAVGGAERDVLQSPLLERG